jgi:hypothetical protein
VTLLLPLCKSQSKRKILRAVAMMLRYFSAPPMTVAYLACVDYLASHLVSMLLGWQRLFFNALISCR